MKDSRPNLSHTNVLMNNNLEIAITNLRRSKLMSWLESRIKRTWALPNNSVIDYLKQIIDCFLPKEINTVEGFDRSKLSPKCFSFQLRLSLLNDTFVLSFPWNGGICFRVFVGRLCLVLPVVRTREMKYFADWEMCVLDWGLE